MAQGFGSCTLIPWLGGEDPGGAEEGFALGDAGTHLMQLHVATHGGFDPAEGEVETPGIFVGCGKLTCELHWCASAQFVLDLRERKRHSGGISVGSERVHPRTAGIGQAKELRDLVVGFTGCVVQGFANVAVAPGTVGGAGSEVEMGMAA